MHQIYTVAASVMILLTAGVAGADVEQAWVDRYDGTAGSTDRGFDVVIDDDGNTFVAGYTIEAQASYLAIKYARNGTRLWVSTSDLGVGEALALDGAGDVIVVGSADFGGAFGLVKLDGDGTILWTRSYPLGPGSVTEFEGVAIDATDAIYAFGNQLSTVTGLWSTYVVKYAADGTFLWDFVYSLSRGTKIAVADDGVYVVGSKEVASHDDDLLVLKLTLSGSFLWERTFGRTGTFANDGAADVAFNSSGNVVVVGGYSFNDSPTGGADIAVVRLTPDGTLISDTYYDGPLGLSDGAEAFVLDDADNAIITGQTEEPTGFDDVIVVKLDSAGNEIWVQTYAGEPGFWDVPRDIAIDHLGDVYVVGEIVFTGLVEYFTIKVDAAGALKWEQRYGGATHNPSNGMAIDVGADLSVSVTGYSRGVSSGDDAATVRYSQGGVIGLPSGEPGPPQVALRVAPNPVGHRAEFSFHSAPDARVLDIFDPAGRLVASMNVTGSRRIGWHPAGTAPAGVYFARLSAAGWSETMKFAISR